MRVECNKESHGFSGKSNDDKGGGRLTVTRTIATMTATMWAMAMAMWLAGNEEGKGKGGKGDVCVDLASRGRGSFVNNQDYQVPRLVPPPLGT
jgi:hypothetical protein